VFTVLEDYLLLLLGSRGLKRLQLVLRKGQMALAIFYSPSSQQNFDILSEQSAKVFNSLWQLEQVTSYVF